MTEEAAASETQAGEHRKRSIQEFWIDFLLEEEFAADPSFLRDFVKACGVAGDSASVERVVHSFSDQFGEADLLVIVSMESPGGEQRKAALLIEDKINAALQPRQAERYRLRGEHGVSKGAWDSYVTVLVAPQAYVPPVHEFDRVVTLEQLKEWICRHDPLRRAFKIQRIDAAIAKKNATGVQIVDADMTAFRAAYYRCLQEFNRRSGAGFDMKPPKDTYYDDNWFIFKCSALPNWAEFRHMGRAGNVELSFKDTDVSKAEALRSLLDEDMQLLATGTHGQHTTIRLPAETINSYDDFERECSKVEAALVNADRIRRVCLGKLEMLLAILGPARKTPLT